MERTFHSAPLVLPGILPASVSFVALCGRDTDISNTQEGEYVLANRTQSPVPAWEGAGAAALHAGPYDEIPPTPDADLTRQRAGALLYRVPAESLWGMDKPRIYAQAGVNIQDPNRRHEMYMARGSGVDSNREKEGGRHGGRQKRLFETGRQWRIDPGRFTVSRGMCGDRTIGHDTWTA